MRFESGRDQIEGKKNNNNIFCNLKKTYFFNCSFLAAPLALHFKDDL